MASETESLFFSVVIPTFNRERELNRSIGSVMHQSFQDWELLVIDDGSSDQTEDLMKQYCKQDQRIAYYKRPDTKKKGPGSCRNLGAELSKGKYVAFLDSDDEWLPLKLQRDFEHLKESESLAHFSDSLIFNGQKINRMSSRDKFQNESYTDLVFSREQFSATPTFVIKREILNEVNFDEDLKRHEDWDLFIKIGNRYGWSRIREANTKIHWSKNIQTFIGFDSMITFYHRHHQNVVKKENLAKYLIWAWITAKRFDYSNANFFLKELRTQKGQFPLKYRIFTLMPELFFIGWRFLRSLNLR